MSSLTFSLFKPPLSTTTKLPSFSTTLSTTFSTLSLSPTTPAPIPTTTTCLTIKAMKSMQGKVVCATNDKTVAVEVTRLTPHPKYKRRVRKKKKFQAHDPDNIFKVGDVVQLEKCRPISKTKTFLAVLPVKKKNVGSKAVESGSGELGIPLQSQQVVEGGVEVV
ncbi:hypothetical protein RND81_11G121300 [Saponaria officinalis]|uniref:Small ribosomal subunit protein uS17c n=1 Tax=Saponaria officinalis TaxID=3572 RepID=A0AAW1HK35_SAPOF